jgi:hypothetical protein
MSGTVHLYQARFCMFQEWFLMRKQLYGKAAGIKNCQNSFATEVGTIFCDNVNMLKVDAKRYYIEFDVK